MKQAEREELCSYLANSATEVMESNFMHNQAKRGGAIYLSTGVHLTVIYSSSYIIQLAVMEEPSTQIVRIT